MANRGIVLGGVRLVHRRTSPLMKVVAATTIALCTVALITLRLAQWDTLNRAQALQQQAAGLQEANDQLSRQIDDLGTVESIRQIAARELGLVDQDTIVIDSE